MDDFMKILKREVEATSATEVARKTGYARSSISLLYNGNYPGNTQKIGARIIQVFSKEIDCPHLKTVIPPAECKEHRESPMPTNNARELRHWTACQNCPNNPGPETGRLKQARADRAAGRDRWWKK